MEVTKLFPEREREEREMEEAAAARVNELNEAARLFAEKQKLDAEEAGSLKGILNRAVKSVVNLLKSFKIKVEQREIPDDSILGTEWKILGIENPTKKKGNKDGEKM
ncbi:MAG: hypothetical protein COV55_00180 [Candidatus Komeilibacteria bacterium CG11_big_fil_rev_8_21_14_0_20_36_20]|uniref:Uncharacterized protein n=1 Tax=Candidatus Komeilibacteria bacterium CG11_big_fil_rev_8_21_14_0_20_36_20 TaxID=1974477 RepID=A0A2H0NGM1_9BACT|nr:MAG: hypothetical protein COV55_00180 [Candidatus Komeilibacteria bacterium CG11_big_fil_rev_8_21_14_0_20_36_20]PIR81530.1 MAG: hypothetical protein COU21_03070 [Candidatus Komeilibacteria bacterium CG10_big_fil_rev_8_21_14_0_10_36_65]PJC55269.1 MAG: hypothetical protein CO027_02980 [Candidatus Komeilibacteria bacterium CG_4_9_14_0_2_um_filter_36_13]